MSSTHEALKTMEQGMRTRIWVIDIPKCYQEDFVQLVIQWYQSSGAEWTIKRLKSLKVDLIRRRAGLDPLTPWVRKNRKGDLAGCLGGLFRWADKSDKNFRKVVQTLMCYSVFVHRKPTESQIEKFSTALSAPPPELDQGYDRFFKSIAKNFGKRQVQRNKDVSLMLYRGASEKRKPSLGFSSVPQDSNILDDVLVLADNGMLPMVLKYWNLYGPVFDGLTIPGPKNFRSKRETWGGKIAFLQEAGGKLRSVASPFLPHQLALRHFGDAVYELARNLPWDCTHDQSLPTRTLQSHLSKGLTVHSVDLSSATDYFPLEVQIRCMESIFGQLPDIELFSKISKSKWHSPIGDVKWNRGQPLGLYPSFAVFTVTHGLLLWYLNGCHWNEDFFVLGDDVVILDDQLYQAYMKVLDEWGCPHSPDKSISSSQICEFAGKIFTSKQVFPQYKWREISNDNFVDICRQLGQRSRILLSRKQREVFDIIKHCTEPLGLNFSFEGSDYLQMEEITHSVFADADDRILDSLVDLARVVNSNLYGSKPSSSSNFAKPVRINSDKAKAKVDTFDEKVRSVLHKLLPWFTIRSNPGQFAGTPGALNNVELPMAILEPSRVTTLGRLRQALGL